MNSLYNIKFKLNESAIIDDDKVSFPIKKKYSLGVSVPGKEAGDNIYRTTYLETKSHENPEVAITTFLLDNNNDIFIEALFETPDYVELHMIEEKVIFLSDQNSQCVISTSTIEEGEELKQKLLLDSRFRDAYDEIIREKTKFDRKKEDDEKQRLHDKSENFYHQWKWLEAKREAGEFDNFLNDK